MESKRIKIMFLLLPNMLYIGVCDSAKIKTTFINFKPLLIIWKCLLAESHHLICRGFVFKIVLLAKLLKNWQTVAIAPTNPALTNNVNRRLMLAKVGYPIYRRGNLIVYIVLNTLKGIN